MPQGALQSVQHVTPSIIRPSIRTRKTCPEKQKQKPRTDRHVTYVLCTDELNKTKSQYIKIVMTKMQMWIADAKHK